MGLRLVAVFALALLAFPVSPALAHHTPTPVPTMKPPKTATPVPTPAPTVAPPSGSQFSQPPAAATPVPVAQQAPAAPGSSRGEAYCHYEPTTGLWEPRWTTNTTLPGPRPVDGICEQPTTPTPTLVPTIAVATATPTPVPATPTPEPTATPVATPTPDATPVPQQTVCGTDEIDCMPPVVTVEEEAPPVPMPPVQLPWPN